MSLDPCPVYDPLGSVFTPTSPSPEPESIFELLLTLVRPSKLIRTSNRKTKNAKSQSENKGPYDVSIKTDWNSFLGIVADKLSVQQTDLVVSSFEWHWLKPSSGPWLPVQDETGFLSMLKKVKSKFELYVMVRMSAPVQRAAAESSGRVQDVEELESDFEDRPAAKKVRKIISRVYLCTQIL